MRRFLGESIDGLTIAEAAEKIREAEIVREIEIDLHAAAVLKALGKIFGKRR